MVVVIPRFFNHLIVNLQELSVDFDSMLQYQLTK